MKLTVLGSSGSLGAPGNPASGYLVQAGGRALIVDLGPGALAALQTVINPSECDLLLSHLHADHCLDVPSLLVWRRYHPTLGATRRALAYGPRDLPRRMGRLSSEDSDHVAAVDDTLECHPWQERTEVTIGPVSVTPYRTVHPVESYAVRIAYGGSVLTYTGDSGMTDELVEAARGADVLLAEATWGEDHAGLPNMHLSGLQAGEIARRAQVKRLVLTHIAPWQDAAATARAARREFAGPVEIASPGMRIEC